MKNISSLFLAVLFCLMNGMSVFAYSEENWDIGTYGVYFPTQYSKNSAEPTTETENSSSSSSSSASTSSPSNILESFENQDSSEVVPENPEELENVEITEIHEDEEILHPSNSSFENPEKENTAPVQELQNETNTKEVHKITENVDAIQTKLAKNESIQNNASDHKTYTENQTPPPILEEETENLHGSSLSELPEYQRNILPYYLISICLILLLFLLTIKKSLHVSPKSIFTLHKISK